MSVDDSSDALAARRIEEESGGERSATHPVVGDPRKPRSSGDEEKGDGLGELANDDVHDTAEEEVEAASIVTNFSIIENDFLASQDDYDKVSDANMLDGRASDSDGDAWPWMANLMSDGERDGRGPQFGALQLSMSVAITDEFGYGNGAGLPWQSKQHDLDDHVQSNNTTEVVKSRGQTLHGNNHRNFARVLGNLRDMASSVWQTIEQKQQRNQTHQQEEAKVEAIDAENMAWIPAEALTSLNNEQSLLSMPIIDHMLTQEQDMPEDDDRLRYNVIDTAGDEQALILSPVQEARDSNPGLEPWGQHEYLALCAAESTQQEDDNDARNSDCARRDLLALCNTQAMQKEEDGANYGEREHEVQGSLQIYSSRDDPMIGGKLSGYRKGGRTSYEAEDMMSLMYEDEEEDDDDNDHDTDGDVVNRRRNRRHKGKRAQISRLRRNHHGRPLFRSGPYSAQLCNCHRCANWKKKEGDEDGGLGLPFNHCCLHHHHYFHILSESTAQCCCLKNAAAVTLATKSVHRHQKQKLLHLLPYKASIYDSTSSLDGYRPPDYQLHHPHKELHSRGSLLDPHPDQARSPNRQVPRALRWRNTRKQLSLKPLPPFPSTRIGAAPYVLCQRCFEILQVPSHVSSASTPDRVQKLRCGSCHRASKFHISNIKKDASSRTEGAVALLQQGLASSPPLPVNQELVTAKHELLTTQTKPEEINPATIHRDSPVKDGGDFSFQLLRQEWQAAVAAGKQAAPASLEHELKPCKSPSSCKAFTRSPVGKLKEICSLNTGRVVAGSPLHEHFGYNSASEILGWTMSVPCNKHQKQHSLEDLSDTKPVRLSKGYGVQTDQSGEPGIDAISISCATVPKLDGNLYPVGKSTTCNHSQELGGGDHRERLHSQKSITGFLKKSLKEIAEITSHAVQHNGTPCKHKKNVNVIVNGHALSMDAIKKAEERAGRLRPGSYWYDCRAGFWGVSGGPCLGIIPPGIEELNYPMSKACSNGTTQVLVNGRELHEKDLKLLARRGLSRKPGRAYILGLDGVVVDEATGKVMKKLGKMAPTVEERGKGFGMYTPDCKDLDRTS